MYLVMEKIVEKLILQIYRNKSHPGIIELAFKYFQMGTVNEVLTKYYWKIQSKRWHFYKPPVRPSTEDLTIYEHFLDKKIGTQNILVLGSTPEIRNLLVVRFPDRQITIAD